MKHACRSAGEQLLYLMFPPAMLVTLQCTIRSHKPVAANMVAAARMMGNCMIVFFSSRSVGIGGGGGGGGVCVVFSFFLPFGDVRMRSSCRFQNGKLAVSMGPFAMLFICCCGI